MLPNKRTRGRPKGTGLNDFAHLKAIAGLMRSDPHLRPTTAIRQLGIQDPSVIRRLRDKFHAFETELKSELRADAQEALEGHLLDPDPVAGETEARAPARAIALATPEGARISQPVAVAARKPAAAKSLPQAAVPLTVAKVVEENPAALKLEARAPAKPDVQLAEPERRQRPARAVALPSETKLPEWLGVGLSVYAMSMEAHFAVVGTLFEWPPLAAVLRTQVAFTELAVAAVRPGLGCFEPAAMVKP